jgi:hypothetical protein
MKNKWHIQEGFTLNLFPSGLSFSLTRDDEEVTFHIDEIDDMIEALKQAQSHIQAKRLRADQSLALARWGKARIPTK